MPKGVPRSEDIRRKISASRKGQLLSPEHRAKLSVAHKGVSLSETHCKAIGKVQKGKLVSLLTRQKISSAQKGRLMSKERHDKLMAHVALDIECRCYAHSPKPFTPSSLTWRLAETLQRLGFKIQPEAQLRRRSIDVLLIDEWLAFEADGGYWHSNKRPIPNATRNFLNFGIYLPFD